MQASVIIPTFQREQFLLDTLSGVRDQDFPKDEYEILIVDNGPHPSPELSGLMDLRGKPVIRYLHEPRNGLHCARHAGARGAQGDILVYIDDDVLCPPEWLAAMLEPYRNSQVAMVAGKVELAFESSPPPWLQQFRGILSALDWGNTAHTVTPYRSPVGCNMSARRSVLYAVGGFNPDGFGDRRLLNLRGDGECGLARKVHNAGFLVWYEPVACLKHRVPASRMTMKYIQLRSALAGIEYAYADLRYQKRSVPELLLRSGGSSLKYFYHKLQENLHRRDETRRYYHLAAASRYRHRALQHWRQAQSPDLRRYTAQKDYLENNLQFIKYY